MHTIVQHFLPGVSVEKNDLRDAVSCLNKEKTHENQDEVSDSRPANSTSTNMIGPREVRPGTTSEIGKEFSTVEADIQRQEDGTLPSDANHFLMFSQQQSQEEILHTDTFEVEHGASTMLWENGTSPWLDKSVNPRVSEGPESQTTTSPCSSLIKENCVFCDEMHVPRMKHHFRPLSVVARIDSLVGFHNGSSMSTFYSRITSSALASIRDGIFQTLPPIEEFLFDGVPQSLVSPLNLPVRAMVSKAATAFFAEINNIIYVLSFERFQIDLEKVYSLRPATTNAKLAVIYLMVALKDPDPDILSSATRYGNASIEEGTLESVQALMIMVPRPP